MTKTTYNPYSGEGRSLGQKSSIYMHVGGTFFGQNDVKKKDEARLRSLLSLYCWLLLLMLFVFRDSSCSLA